MFGPPILVKWRGGIQLWPKNNYIKIHFTANFRRHLKWCSQKFDKVHFCVIGDLEEVLIMVDCKLVIALATMTYMVGSQFVRFTSNGWKSLHGFIKKQWIFLSYKYWRLAFCKEKQFSCRYEIKKNLFVSFCVVYIHHVAPWIILYVYHC